MEKGKIPLKWDGKSSKRIVDIIEKNLMILFFKKVNLYFNTLKYLQFSQIIYRFKFFFPIFKNKITNLPIPNSRIKLNLSTHF